MSNITMPKHIAIIMDGNGRWAKKKGMLRTFGHKSGVESVRTAVRFCRNNHIQSLTLFAFSSENWFRPPTEVRSLMELFQFVLGREIKKLHKNDVRLHVIGDTSRFDPRLVAKIAEAEELTRNNQSLTLNIAANYGGKWEVVNTCRKLIDKCQTGELSPDALNEEMFFEQTSLANQPEVDLLIRTGGDMRISNFLLWHIAYAELYFTQTLWPDFGEKELMRAIEEYTSRQRRYGRIAE